MSELDVEFLTNRQAVRCTQISARVDDRLFDVFLMLHWLDDKEDVECWETYDGVLIEVPDRVDGRYRAVEFSKTVFDSHGVKRDLEEIAEGAIREFIRREDGRGQ